MPLDIYPVPTAASNTQPSWTLLSSSTGNGTNTITFTGISGYRRLRLVLTGLYGSFSNEWVNVQLRLNGDSGTNYAQLGTYFNSSGSFLPSTYRNASSSYELSQILASNGSTETRKGWGIVEIDGANTTEVIKNIVGSWGAFSTNSLTSVTYHNINGIYRSSSAAITSLSVVSDTGNFATMTSPAGIYLYGAN